jgi:hypothetical protein
VASVECGEPVDYFTPAGTHGRVLCDLPPSHEGEHDSGELLLRPGDAPRVLLAGA